MKHPAWHAFVVVGLGVGWFEHMLWQLALCLLLIAPWHPCMHALYTVGIGLVRRYLPHTCELHSDLFPTWHSSAATSAELNVSARATTNTILYVIFPGDQVR